MASFDLDFIGIPGDFEVSMMFEGLKNLFSKKKEKDPVEIVRQEVSNQLIDQDSRVSRAFGNAKADIQKLSHWVFYLNKRNSEVAGSLQKLDNGLKSMESGQIASKEQISSLKASIDLLRNDLNHSQQWTNNINNRLFYTESSIRAISTEISNFNQRRSPEALEPHYQELKTSLALLQEELSILKTKQLSPLSSVAHIPQELPVVTVNDTQLRDVTGLSSSEKAVLRHIYSESMPQTYAHISAKIKLNYGTVKNIICRLRKKGFSVEDQVSPQGEKEFFLTKNIKLTLSGR